MAAPFAAQNAAQVMPVGDHRRAPVAHHIDRRMRIAARQFVRLDVEAARLAPGVFNEMAGIVANRFEADRLADAGSIQLGIVIDRLAGQPETLFQDHAQQRVAGTGIGGKPGDQGIVPRVSDAET